MTARDGEHGPVLFEFNVLKNQFIFVYSLLLRQGKTRQCDREPG